MQNIAKNRFSYYEVIEKPSKEELKQYYENKYYQQQKGVIQKIYSSQEIAFFGKRAERKIRVIEKYFEIENKSFLDVGCGEGWSLKSFKEAGFTVNGIDYSSYGIQTQNPDLLGNFENGDIIVKIEELQKSNTKYDVILLDNVLEHLLDPLETLQTLYSLLEEEGCLIIEVPNDFSVLQSKLLNEGHIDKEFWVAIPDHLSYFNSDGLKNICEYVGFQQKHLSTDYPIDLNLFNENTNYVKDKSKGKSAHLARVDTEILLDSISQDKTLELYNKFAELGLGRNIIAFFGK
jgi:2-polyprenyl-3-methyl-5-hydroxy-6-metoxy-1,4-benzoquinol methylase